MLWSAFIDKNFVRAVLLDFSAAFAIIDHNLLLKNVGVVDLHHLPYYGLRVTYLIEHRGFSLIKASLMQIQLSVVSRRAAYLGCLFS